MQGLISYGEIVATDCGKEVLVNSTCHNDPDYCDDYPEQCLCDRITFSYELERLMNFNDNISQEEIENVQLLVNDFIDILQYIQRTKENYNTVSTYLYEKGDTVTVAFKTLSKSLELTVDFHRKNISIEYYDWNDIKNDIVMDFSYHQLDDLWKKLVT